MVKEELLVENEFPEKELGDEKELLKLLELLEEEFWLGEENQEEPTDWCSWVCDCFKTWK